jgi:hypothetical protein
MREQVIRICVDLDRVAEAGFARCSQGAGGFGEAAHSAGEAGREAGAEGEANPLRVPILIAAAHVPSYP